MARPTQFPPVINHHQTAKEKRENRPGRARVWVRGRWISLGVWGSPEVQTRYQQVLADLTRTQPPRQRLTLAAPTIAEVAEQYLTHLEKTRGVADPETGNYQRAVAPLVRLFGQLPAASFDADRLETLQESLASGSWLTEAEKREREKCGQPIGWCLNLTNRMIVRVRAVFRWAERKKLVPPGSWAALRAVEGLKPNHPLARSTVPRKPSTREEVEKVKQHCPDAVAAMLELQWLAGMRSGEVRIMRTRDIDQSGSVWLYRPGSDQPFGTHKNAWRKQLRVVMLGPECQRLLLPWLRLDQPEAYLFQPRGARRKFTVYSRHAYAQAVRRACKLAGVKLTPYAGRHAAALRVKRALGIEAAKAFLGQKSLRVCENYGGLDMELGRQAATDCG